MRVEIVLKTGGTSVLKTTSTDAVGAAAAAKAGHNDAVDEEQAFQVGSKRARSEHAEWGYHRHKKPPGPIDDDNVGPQDMDAEEDNIVELEEKEHVEEEEEVDDNWEHLNFGDENEQEPFCSVEEDSSEYAPSTSNTDDDDDNSSINGSNNSGGGGGGGGQQTDDPITLPHYCAIVAEEMTELVDTYQSSLCTEDLHMTPLDADAMFKWMQQKLWLISLHEQYFWHLVCKDPQVCVCVCVCVCIMFFVFAIL